MLSASRSYLTWFVVVLCINRGENNIMCWKPNMSLTFKPRGTRGRLSSAERNGLEPQMNCRLPLLKIPHGINDAVVSRFAKSLFAGGVFAAQCATHLYALLLTPRARACKQYENSVPLFIRAHLSSRGNLYLCDCDIADSRVCQIARHERNVCLIAGR